MEVTVGSIVKQDVLIKRIKKGVVTKVEIDGREYGLIHTDHSKGKNNLNAKAPSKKVKSNQPNKFKQPEHTKTIKTLK